MITLALADLTEPQLRQEILKLRRRVEKLATLLRLALALLHGSGFRLSGERLPDGPAKRRILRAVDRARGCLPLRGVLRFLGLSPRRLQTWRRRQHCVCARRSVIVSSHLTASTDARRGPAIGDMVTSADYRHVPTGTLAVLAQRLGKASASPSTWYRLSASMAGGVLGCGASR